VRQCKRCKLRQHTSYTSDTKTSLKQLRQNWQKSLLRMSSRFVYPHQLSVALQGSEGPWFNSNLGAVSCFGPKGWSWKPEVLRAGVGLWGGPATGPMGSGVSSPSGEWGPQPPTVLILFAFSDDLSCYWKPWSRPIIFFTWQTFWLFWWILYKYVLLFSCLKFLYGPTRGPQELG